MTRPFAKHWERKLAPRPSWGKQSTINGRPAWQVVEERRKAAQYPDAS